MCMYMWAILYSFCLFSVPGDVIEYIMPRLIDQTRTRRSILKQLKWLGIIETSKDLQPAKAP